ncbi:MAG: DUF853 family protein [Candidatus Schmidhempelia sp.]|nr:DUF853 family protein [Candidatus Schmidhempelia sp.]
MFKLADDKQLLLLDFKDLNAAVRFVVGNNAKQFTTECGNISIS